MYPHPDGSRGSLLFGLCMAGFLGMLAVFIFRDGREARRAAAWPAVPCEVVASGVEETPDDEHPYRLQVTYRYEWNGRRLTSDRVRMGKWGITSEDIAEIERRVRALPPGAKATCYV